MLRRRDFLRITGISGLYLYVNSVSPVFGRLVTHQSTKSDNLHWALSIAENIESSTSRVEAICKVAEGFYQIGKKRVADDLVNKALKISFTTKRKKAKALRAVAEYYMQADNFEKALQIINTMNYMGMDKLIMLFRASFLAYSKGDFSLSDRILSMVNPPCTCFYINPASFSFDYQNTEALKWLERVHQVCKKTDYAGDLATFWFKMGDFGKGLKYLEEVWTFSPPDAVEIGVSYLPETEIRAFEERIFRLSDRFLKIDSLFKLAEYYTNTKKDQVRAGEIIAKIMKTIGNNGMPDQYAVLGSLLVRNGRTEEGRKYLSSVPDRVIDMFSDKESEDLMSTLSYYLDELLNAYITAGLQDEFTLLLSELEARGIKYDEPLWYYEILKKTEVENYRDNIYCFLINEIKRVSKKDLPDRINALSVIGKTLLALGEKERGLEITKDVLEYLERLLSDGDIKNRVDFGYLSTTPYENKSTETIFLNAVPGLALELARCGFAAEAEIIANIVDDRRLSDKVHFNLASYFIRAGRFQDALKTAQKIRGIEERDIVLFEVVKGLIDTTVVEA